MLTTLDPAADSPLTANSVHPQCNPQGAITSSHQNHRLPPETGLRHSGQHLRHDADPGAGTPMMLYPDYAVSWQRFLLDWRYTG
jgi:hypothetical protein